MLKRVLISVFDKRNLVQLGQYLAKKGAHVLSTGGTFRTLQKHVPTLDLQQVSLYTGHPECLGGRVKTLHPRIHAGILADRDNMEHMDEMATMDIALIDTVVVNLYPFEQVLQSGETDDKTIREMIDIGGQTVLRSGAKNHPHVTVVCDPSDYKRLMMDEPNTPAFRRALAAKAFHHVTTYDMAIARYMNPTHRYRAYEPVRMLKYGLNPQQQFASLYKRHDQPTCPFTVLNGNPGYINMMDAIYGYNLVQELQRVTGRAAVASYKHTSPAGVALDNGNAVLNDAEQALFMVGNTTLSPLAVTFLRARFGDPMSSFGDFVSVSTKVDLPMATLLKREVSDGIVAPDYEPDALALLKTKKKGGYVILQGDTTRHDGEEVRDLHGVTLIQDANLNETALPQDVPTEAALDLVLANTTLKYTQSNSVCAALDGQLIGVGAGQQSRVDCVKLVRRKTETWKALRAPSVRTVLAGLTKGLTRTQKINALLDTLEQNPLPVQALGSIALASDAFFPFRDSIDVAASFGVKYVIQPGGSIADAKVQAACKEKGIHMTLTGRDMRMFLH